MENTIYLSSAYLAPVEYYTKLFACEKAYVEQYDNYVNRLIATVVSLRQPMVRWR